MSRLRTSTVVLSLLLALFAVTVFGQGSPGVVATFHGTISNPSQVDHVTLDVDSDHFGMNTGGDVDLLFLMSSESAATGALDPGLISVDPKSGGTVRNNMRRPDTATSTASIALATLTPGTYDISLRGEHKTTGAYRLEVLLAGDANTDYQVDAADLQVIAELQSLKSDDSDYSAPADVDRNGTINGGDRQRAEANLGAKGPAPEADNPLDQSLPEGALTLAGASPKAFVSRTGGLRFSLAGAEFDGRKADIMLTINGARVPAEQLSVEPHLLTANVTLANGRNKIALKAYDTIGRPLYYNTTLWAGSSTLRVNLVNPNGTAFTQQANVIAALSDDPGVTAQGITTTGTITFTNVPARTILVKASGIGNEFGTTGAVGSQGVVTVKMIGFNAPSSIKNNDISLGTAGWVIGAGSPVSVVQHKEDIPGFLKAAPGLSSLKATTTQSITDQDLMLGTSGLGEKTLSRTFTTEKGTTAVKIRYRFITSEVPGGYFGSQFNDYFRVSLRSQTGGGAESETNSMNGLGLEAFNFPTGETNWREITLTVAHAGDTIQADLAVANVGDGAFQSQVVVDFVEEIKDQVRPALAWNDTQGGLTLTWEVLDRPLEGDMSIEVYFASGTAYDNRLGAALFTHVVPAGSPVGSGGPGVHVPGTGLDADPDGTTHLLAASSKDMIGVVQDVSIGYGGNADASAVSGGMIDIIKDGLRAAGVSHGSISSTARTPADQARAMFTNCFNSGAQSQLDIYGPPGDAVVQVYIAQTAGKTRAQIEASADAIRAAMAAEIIAQGPERVSRHCGDPAVRTVVDMPSAQFNGTNGTLFINAVSGRVSRFIDERSVNHCYHLELGL